MTTSNLDVRISNVRILCQGAFTEAVSPELARSLQLEPGDLVLDFPGVEFQVIKADDREKVANAILPLSGLPRILPIETLTGLSPEQVFGIFKAASALRDNAYEADRTFLKLRKIKDSLVAQGMANIDISNMPLKDVVRLCIQNGVTLEVTT
jgi:hypothetical protein